jgi:hypothetical protein
MTLMDDFKIIAGKNAIPFYVIEASEESGDGFLYVKQGSRVNHISNGVSEKSVNVLVTTNIGDAKRFSTREDAEDLEYECNEAYPNACFNIVLKWAKEVV